MKTSLASAAESYQQGGRRDRDSRLQLEIALAHSAFYNDADAQMNLDQAQVCVAVWCLLHCVASVMQCVAVRCSVLQCVAVWCSVMQCVAVCRSVVQCGAVCCSVVQCGAVCCSVVQ